MTDSRAKARLHPLFLGGMYRTIDDAGCADLSMVLLIEISLLLSRGWDRLITTVLPRPRRKMLHQQVDTHYNKLSSFKSNVLLPSAFAASISAEMLK